MPHRFAVFFLTVAVLAATSWLSPISAVYTNPVEKIRAQDESFYSSIALNMAFGGEWLSPKFLNRFAFNKPPLAIWLPALFVKLSSPSKLALRAPSVLAGGLTALLLFLWIVRTEGVQPAWAGVLLLLSDYWFSTLGKLAMTDSLLLAAMTAAYFLLAQDRGLEKGHNVIWFGLATGLAMLTKSVAALPALLALAILAPRNRKLPALLIAGSVAFLIAAPWHIYQLFAHGNWFWAEYVLDEHLGWGLAAPTREGQPGNFIFYSSTLLKTCPWLVAAALLGIWQKRNWVALVAALLTLACMLIFQFHNATYLLGFNALLAVAAASWFRGWRLVLPIVLAVVGLGLQIKANLPLRENQAIAALENYCTLERGNELRIVDPDDELYSAALPLARVGYIYREDSALRRQSPLDFRKMGIVISTADYLNQSQKLAGFQAELQQMGLFSTAPIATLIAARSELEIQKVIRAKSDIDFLLPAALLPLAEGAPHRIVSISKSHILLESFTSETKHSHACGLLR